MGNLAADTAVQGASGRYQARLSEDWAVWGPFGGYVAAVALRAAGAETRLARPASFTCHFLSVAEFDVVDIEVSTLRQSKRAEALRVAMTQGGKDILQALVWTVDGDMRGLEHEAADMPEVAPPASLKSFGQLVDNYDEWYSFWRNVEARPTQWMSWEEWKPREPRWRVWMRLVAGGAFDDPFLDAARAVLFLDTATWPAASEAHQWPRRFIAPNLDLTVHFHRTAPQAEWLLTDGFSPVARDGLMGCTGHLWTEQGELVASSAAQLVCRPNPMYEEEQKRFAEQQAARAQSD